MEKQLQYKALYITNQFPVPGSNSGTFTIQRIKALQRSDIEIVVACPVNKTPPQSVGLNIKGAIKCIKEQSAIPDQAEVERITVHYLKRFQAPQPIFGWYSHLFLYWQTIGELKKIVFQVRPDVIISAWLPSGVVACKLGKHFGIPVMVLAEGSDVNFLPSHLRYWHIARNILNKGAAAQVFVSNALKEQALQVGLNGKRMVVIYNGVDEELFSFRNKDSATNAQKILGVGRLESVKGFQFLIDALFIISKEYDHPVHLTIVGDGSLKNTLAEQVHRLDLDEHVDFVPTISQPDLAKYYQDTDLLCVPSLQESFGCVLIEAMACGTPVVASRIGGIPEIVDPGSGILVSPGRPDELAEGLINALARGWDGKLIRERVVNNFTWSHTGKAFLELVQEVVENFSK